MRLGEIIRGILSGTAAERASKSGRAEQRFDLRAPVTLKILDAKGAAKGTTKGWLRNLSKSGAGVICQQRVPAGTSFTFRVPLPDEAGEVDLCYESVRCMKVADGVYQIGAKSVPVPAGCPAESGPKHVRAVDPATQEIDRIRAAMFSA